MRGHRCSLVLGAVGNKVSISIQRFKHCNYGSVISQFGVLASHQTNFESVAQRRLGIIHIAIWEVPFF